MGSIPISGSMKKINLVIILIIIRILIGIFYCLDLNKEADVPEESGEEIFSQQEVMEYLDDHIGKISPEEPVLGGSWHITAFWFISDKNLYIDYEDGHIIRRVLIELVKDLPSLEYKIIGYFEPGEGGWFLKEGEDPYFDAALDLYQKDKETGKWSKQN